MIIYTVALLFCFLMFLFVLYMTAKEDIVFIKRNISLEMIYNVAFLGTLIGVISARFLYALGHMNSGVFHFIGFFLLFHRPGLSLIGGILGGFLFLFWYSYKKKYPVGRLFDYFSLSLLSIMPFGFFASLFLSRQINFFQSIYMPVIYLILLFLLLRFLYPLFLRGEMGNGVIGSMFLLTFAFITVVTHFANNEKGIIFFLGLEDFVAIGIVVGFLVFLIRQERSSKKVHR